MIENEPEKIENAISFHPPINNKPGWYMKMNGITKPASPRRTACRLNFVTSAPAIAAAAYEASATGGVIADNAAKKRMKRWAAMGSTPKRMRAGATTVPVIA
jgi:hypothetical protein